MELSELEKTWQAFGQRLEENTKINKQVLREMMSYKPKKRLRFLQAESSLRTIGFITLCAVFILKFDTSILSFRGVMLGFVIVFGGLHIYFNSFQVVRLLSKIEFSMSIQEINGIFVRLEKSKLHLKTLNVWSYLISILLLGYLFITKGNIIVDSGGELLIPISIVGIGGIVFSIIRTRILNRQMRKLKDELNELDEMG